jgi:uncharacterized protein
MYTRDDVVHDFDHVLRVYFLAERMAIEEEADLEVVRAAALLHDVEDGSGRADHHEVSALFARKTLEQRNWLQGDIRAVEHCIRAHRYRKGEDPQTIEAQVIFDADKLDAIGAIGVARALAYAVQAGQPLYESPSARFLESGQKESGESHSAYHEFIFKLRNIKERLYTNSGKRIARHRHAFMVQYFEFLGDEIRGLR